MNTVLFKTAEVLGYNTDYKAAMDCLENALGRRSAPNAEPAARTSACWCSGPAAWPGRSMYGLQRRGAKATIASRTRSRAEQLADAFGGQARRLAGPPQRRRRHHRQLHADRHAPNVDESPFDKTLPEAVDGRVRHGLQSRDDAADQGSPRRTAAAS